jgi:hypothetical protein
MLQNETPKETLMLGNVKTSYSSRSGEYGDLLPLVGFLFSDRKNAACETSLV